MRLIPLWEADLEKAYGLHRCFPPEENGFENPAFGLSLEEFREYVRRREANSQGRELPQGFVPDTVYVLENDAGDYVGIFNLRHRLNDALREGPGHIGYGIRPGCRGRGYATQGLALALEKARQVVPEEEIYLSVHKDNPASLRVQLKNGGAIHHEDGLEYYTRFPKGPGTLRGATHERRTD